MSGSNVRISAGRFGAAITDSPECVLRQHDLQELAVEPLRPRLDFLEVEPRLEIEIVGAGAVLEIEVDQAGAGLAARRAVEQQHRGLDRDRGDAGAADRGQEGVDLRLFGLGGRGRSRHPRAGSHQLDRLHRLYQEVGHPHLQQPTRHVGIEAPRPPRWRQRADARHQPLQRLHLVLPAGVEVDDDDGRACQIERVAGLGNGGRDHLEIDLRAGVERRCGQAARIAGSAVKTTTPVRFVALVDRVIRGHVLLPCRHVLKACCCCLPAPTPTELLDGRPARCLRRWRLRLGSELRSSRSPARMIVPVR